MGKTRQDTDVTRLKLNGFLPTRSDVDPPLRQPGCQAMWSPTGAVVADTARPPIIRQRATQTANYSSPSPLLPVSDRRTICVSMSICTYTHGVRDELCRASHIHAAASRKFPMNPSVASAVGPLPSKALSIDQRALSPSGGLSSVILPWAMRCHE